MTVIDWLIRWLRPKPRERLPAEETEPQEDLIMAGRLARAEAELRARGWLALAPLEEEHNK